MKTSVLTTIVILVSLCKTSAQANDTTDVLDRLANRFRYDTFEYRMTKNHEWAKNSETVTFENQGKYHSTYLALNNDSTFVFLSVYEPGEFLTVGMWTKPNDTTYTLNWDRNATLVICKDRMVFSKYYKYGTPMPFTITDWMFIKRDSFLLPFPINNKSNN